MTKSYLSVRERTGSRGRGQLRLLSQRHYESDRYMLTFLTVVKIHGYKCNSESIKVYTLSVCSLLYAIFTIIKFFSKHIYTLAAITALKKI